MDAKNEKRSGSRNRSEGNSASLLGRYYTAIENLILFLFSRSSYLTALRTMAHEEVEYRIGLIVKGLILLTLALFFLFSSMAYFFILALFALQHYTGNWIVSSGILFILFLALFFILRLLARDLLRRLTEKRPASPR